MDRAARRLFYGNVVGAAPGHGYRGSVDGYAGALATWLGYYYIVTNIPRLHGSANTDDYQITLRRTGLPEIRSFSGSWPLLVRRTRNSQPVAHYRRIRPIGDLGSVTLHTGHRKSLYQVQNSCSRGTMRPLLPIFALMLLSQAQVLSTSAIAGGWMDPTGAWNVNVAGFWKAIDKQCPHRRWRHATMGAYEGPIDEVSKALSAAQRRAVDVEVSTRCRDVNGEGCANEAAIDVIARTDHMQELVRAFCAVEPQHFD